MTTVYVFGAKSPHHWKTPGSLQRW